VHRRGFGCEIVYHVLIVLADAIAVVQCLAIESQPNAVWTVSNIEILGPNPSDDPDVACFYAIRLRRK
jgi:hypothetical protein